MQHFPFSIRAKCALAMKTLFPSVFWLAAFILFHGLAKVDAHHQEMMGATEVEKPTISEVELEMPMPMHMEMPMAMAKGEICYTKGHKTPTCIFPFKYKNGNYTKCKAPLDTYH